MKIQFISHGKHITPPLQGQAVCAIYKKIYVYCDDHVKHTNALCGHNEEF
jgi:hypothetical protein